MTTEEKAKRYDELFVKASRIYIKENDVLIMHTIEDLFPELKESEDERIRKALINGFNKLDKSAVWYNGITNAQVLDWLEKQANHANFRNKIQIGDKVTRNRDGVLINLSQLNRVAKVEKKQGNNADKIIERAKTEKQRVLLTETNGNANIDWDTRSLQDVKLLLEYGLDYIKKLEKQGEQKPTDEKMKELLQTEYEKGRADAIAEMQKSWSEDDERIFKSLKTLLNDASCYSCTEGVDKILSWLKSLKDRYTWKPSEEQMVAIDTAINVLGKGTLNGKQLIELQEQLKALQL